MGWVFELSWLWKTLGIALSVSLICVVCGNGVQSCQKDAWQEAGGAHRRCSFCGRRCGSDPAGPDSGADMNRPLSG